MNYSDSSYVIDKNKTKSITSITIDNEDINKK